MKQLAKHWRVFYTFARSEKKAEGHLGDQGYEVYVPKRTVVRQWSDRKKKVEEPLFRNYLFARVDERERLAVVQAPGIVRCLFYNGAPAEVTGEEIAQIRLVEKDPMLALIDYPRPGVGELVEVVEGPMKGLKGEVLEHRGQIHVVVRVEAIRQALRVNVPGAWVQPLAEASV